MKLIKLLVVLLVGLCINPALAQEEMTDVELSTAINESTYQEIKNQIDLTKTKKALRLKEFEPKEKKKKEKKEKTRSLFSGFQSLGIFQVLSYVLILGLVAFLIYMIFSNIEIDKKFELSKEAYALDNIDDIQALDTEALLKEALDRGDFRTAVRIRFLAVLKDLSKQEKINWKRDKTNRDYNRELSNQSYGNKFNELTYIFDYVWYGKQQLVKSHYDHIDRQFNSFKNLMNG